MPKYCNCSVTEERNLTWCKSNLQVRHKSGLCGDYCVSIRTGSSHRVTVFKQNKRCTCYCQMKPLPDTRIGIYCTSFSYSLWVQFVRVENGRIWIALNRGTLSAKGSLPACLTPCCFAWVDWPNWLLRGFHMVNKPKEINYAANRKTQTVNFCTPIFGRSSKSRAQFKRKNFKKNSKSSIFLSALTEYNTLGWPALQGNNMHKSGVNRWPYH